MQASDSQETSEPPLGSQDSSVGNREMEKTSQLWTVLSGFTIPIRSSWVSDIIPVPQCSHLGGGFSPCGVVKLVS